MAQKLTAQEVGYIEAFEALQKNAVAQHPAWLRELRKAAMACFSETGLPTTRRGNEEWKYTDIGPMSKIQFESRNTPKSLTVTPNLLEWTSHEPGWSQLTFLDGSYMSELSSVASMPSGITVMSLAEAMTTKGDLVEQHLAKCAPYDSNPFTALNTAFLHDGAFVHVPKGVNLASPLHLLFVLTSESIDATTHPRVLVVFEEESAGTIVESYVGLSNNQYFTNAVTEVVAGAGSTVKHYKIQQQSERAFHITNTHDKNYRDSSYASVNIDLGGRLVRNNLNVLMEQEGSSCMLNGLYMVTGTQHVDNQVIIDHASSHTYARELYKGILDGQSRSVFHGSIIVRGNIRKVDALQVDKNLLLSDQAEADTKPAFWIYSDDVKCGHGAACGQLDESMTFYLRSRGVGEDAARGLLVRGFVTEVIDSIDNESVRIHVDQLVHTKLQEWLEG